MPSKTKGSNAERELVHLFWQTGNWAAIRIAGSGSSQYPSADILASNTQRKLAIEAKITKDRYKHFPNEEIQALKEFADKFGAEPWIALRFKSQKWKFFPLADLKQTSNHYSINQDLSEKKGLSFDELIKDI